MKLAIGRFDINAHLRARRKWREGPRWFKGDAERHFVWGRISVHVEDGEAEVVPTCAACDSDEIGEQSRGDESWTICTACRSVEQGYVYVSRREAERRG